MNIGNINIDRAIVLAPMEDVTDIAFRVICKRLGADMVYTEFVNSEGLIRDSGKTRDKMLFWPEERPFGIQIYGGEEASMEGASRIAESFEPDLIDINCGCWVKDVALRGAGAGLLRDLPRMERIVTTVVKTVSVPVTVKTRLGWDSESIRIVDVAKMLEQAGVRALTIHCRTRAQGHKGDPDFSFIPSVKRAVSIPILVNGSIETPERIKEVFDLTECDGVMIGRGAIDNPWIFRHARHFLTTGALSSPPTLRERLEVLETHFQLSVQVKGERKGVIEFRKHLAGYLKGFPHSSRLRQELMQFVEQEPLLDRIRTYFEFVESGQPTDALLAQPS
ncbi:MAG: tRNA dihydrouridine synthase DusB [Ignavibacteriales bacterium]|nr:tRNA dihydrouridine synthase DusB [Ignavibacteriales bacterium]